MEIPVLLYIRTVGTHEESGSRKRKSRCKRLKRLAGKSVSQSESAMRRELKYRRPWPLWREKPLLCIQHPYRKPTQVDEERILRPAGEALLRNSAKLPRNFGRRGATEMWPQRIGSSNCLAKTQVYAKPKGEVYGLTPARCWKVKRRC